MAEPITLAVVGTVVLTEGIKFLYSQAGEVLKCWRERRAAQEGATQAEQVAPVEVKLPDAFEGQLAAPKIHFDAVALLDEEMRELRKDLSDYAEGIEPVDTQNAELLTKVDALRYALEAVFQQRITFRGEPRPVSGPIVEGHIDVNQVTGYVAAVRAKRIRANAKAERVEAGGQFTGVNVDTIGGEADFDRLPGDPTTDAPPPKPSYG